MLGSRNTETESDVGADLGTSLPRVHCWLHESAAGSISLVGCETSSVWYEGRLESEVMKWSRGLEAWRSGGLEVWRSGGLEVWRSGGLEVWRSGGLEAWRSGGLEAWRPGGLEVWRSGGLGVWRSGGLEVWRSGGLEDWRSGGLEAWRSGGLEVCHGCRETALQRSQEQEEQEEQTLLCPAAEAFLTLIAAVFTGNTC
ncbi:hypothetical protein EYF80_061295 [Liparis tanakae]|uniref:Uncharacterized protein n=1 Tax=Liparis tanakae TaxID=230148 RepID=A0A4Z2EIH9_9TELE|nr:hypothetical protein EYF80_061295 [Liparis tanakae]